MCVKNKRVIYQDESDSCICMYEILTNTIEGQAIIILNPTTIATPMPVERIEVGNISEPITNKV